MFRYVNTLDPDLKMGNWTKSEDIELIKLIKKFGYGKNRLLFEYMLHTLF